MDNNGIPENAIDLHVTFRPGDSKYTEEQIVVKIMNALFDDSARTIITPYAQEIASLTTQLAEAVKDRDTAFKGFDGAKEAILKSKELIDQAREEASAYRKCIYDLNEQVDGLWNAGVSSQLPDFWIKNINKAQQRCSTALAAYPQPVKTE